MAACLRRHGAPSGIPEPVSSWRGQVEDTSTPLQPKSHSSGTRAAFRSAGGAKRETSQQAIVCRIVLQAVKAVWVKLWISGLISSVTISSQQGACFFTCFSKNISTFFLTRSLARVCTSSRRCGEDCATAELINSNYWVQISVVRVTNATGKVSPASESFSLMARHLHNYPATGGRWGG